MKIQDVEIRTGLDRATIRFYEKERILIPERADNGYRNYSDDDAELLLKIKLLRKLGVSLPTIKALQKGSEDLSDVLSRQIQILEQQIQSDTRARAVCAEMRNDYVQYATLDSERYLQKLSSPLERTDFRENVNDERHPIRRFIARDIDLLLTGALMHVLMIMVLRIRPCSEVFMLLIQILSYAAVLPTEALMLNLWGTTPGKWLMGIHLDDPNGGKLSFSAAFTRTWHVALAGLGLYIPILSQIRLILSYNAVSEGRGTYWDDEAEMFYSEPAALKIVITLFAVIGALLLNSFAIRDAALPRYRSENLTMQKFVANYHDYEKSFQNDNTMILDDDGTWTERTNMDIVIIQIGDSTHKRKDFQYTYNKKGGIQTISFQDSWDDMQMMSALPDYCTTALYSVVGSRPGANARDLTQLDELIQTEFGMPMQEGGGTSGEFRVSDVVFAWEAQLPEGEFIYLHDLGGMIMSFSDGSDIIAENEDQAIPYKLEFKITIGE